MASRIPLVVATGERQQLQAADVIADSGGLRYVRGPATSTDECIARYDGTTGILLQDSAAILTDAATNRISLGGSPLNPPTAAATLRGTGDPDSSFHCYRISNDTSSARLRIHKARGTPGSEADVQNLDDIGVFTFNAYRNGSYQGSVSPASAAIRAAVSGAVSGDSVPADLVFLVTAVGATTNAEVLRLTNTGAFTQTIASPNSNSIYTVTDGTNTLLQIRTYTEALSSLAFGDGAGASITTGTFGIYIGNNAGNLTTTAISNLCIGAFSGENNVSSFGNTYIGTSAGRNATGQENVGIGGNACHGAVGFDGDFNTCIGGNAGLNFETTATQNVLIANSAGRSLTTGSSNIFFGHNTGFNASQKVDAANCILIGPGLFSTVDGIAIIGTTSVNRTILRGDTDIALGNTATRLNVYNTAAADPPGTSYERIATYWSSNVARISTQKGAGGGSTRNLAIDHDDVERILLSSTETVLNDPGGDVDTRIESDDRSHMLFIDADTNNLIIAATSLPAFQSMVGGTFVEDATTAPTGNPTAGFYMYSSSGAPTFRSSGGVITDLTTVVGGVYTPTATSATNLDATPTMTQAQYMRVGPTVTVSGRFTADPTAPGAADFEIDLPVASNIGAAEDVAGVAFSGAIAGQGAEIIGVVANDTAQIQWVAVDVTSQLWSYTFTYRVI